MFIETSYDMIKWLDVSMETDDMYVTINWLDLMISHFFMIDDTVLSQIPRHRLSS